MGQDRRPGRRDGGVAAGAGRARDRCASRAARLHAISRRIRADRDREAAHAVCGRAGADRAGAPAGQRGRAHISSIIPAFYDRPGTPYQAPDGTRLARQPPALRAAGLGGGGAGARRRPGMAARSAALPRLARRAGPGLSAGAGRRGAERLHRAQHRVSGIFPGPVLCRSGVAAGLFLGRRGRVLWRAGVHQGRAVLRRPADDGQPDLCARNPDPGFRLGPRRAAAHPRR